MYIYYVVALAWHTWIPESCSWRSLTMSHRWLLTLPPQPHLGEFHSARKNTAAKKNSTRLSSYFIRKLLYLVTSSLWNELCSDIYRWTYTCQGLAVERRFAGVEGKNGFIFSVSIPPGDADSVGSIKRCKELWALKWLLNSILLKKTRMQMPNMRDKLKKRVHWLKYVFLKLHVKLVLSEYWWLM